MMCDRMTAAPMHSLVSWVDFLLLHKKYVLYYISELTVYLQWTTFLDSEGRVMDSKSLRKRIFYGGVEHNLRAEVWVFEDDIFVLETCYHFISFSYVLYVPSLLWVSSLWFTGLDILNGIPWIWFNICREGIPHVHKEVRVWNHKKAMAG